jgi:hypothetical protein
MVKQKHKLIWFLNRIGELVIKNNNISLFNDPVLIADKHHAKALYLSQSEKNFTYSQT